MSIDNAECWITYDTMKMEHISQLIVVYIVNSNYVKSSYSRIESIAVVLCWLRKKEMSRGYAWKKRHLGRPDAWQKK